MDAEQRDPLTEKIIACCYKIHSQIGPGFQEKIYHNALKIIIKKENIKHESEKEFHVYFDKVKAGTFRCDLLVEEKVIVEIKAVSGRMPILFEHQLLSYLKASGIKVGLLINFGNPSCEVRRLMK
jgi:GxxExxY protein